MNKSIVLFLIITVNICLLNKPLKSQSLGQLIKIESEQSKDLIVSRGVYDDDISTDFSMLDIQNKINSYSKNVGLLWYNYHEEELHITFLMKNSESPHERKYNISQDSLTNLIHTATLFYSKGFDAFTPINRGISSLKNERYILDAESIISIVENLLLPFKKELSTLEHIVIIPALNIGTLPFSALKLDAENYLIDLMSYHIAPSLGEFMNHTESNTCKKTAQPEINKQSTRALLVANPLYPNDSLWHFPTLPGTEKEIELFISINDNKSYRLLKGKEATYSNISRHFCESNIIYFATHGISNHDNALDNSFLVITPDSSHNGFLTARQIQEFRNNVGCKSNLELVIMSACQTGLGQTHEGGVIGLARAFQLAGADNILMSLWNINDAETVKLMGVFNKLLNSSDSILPHKALQKSILKFKIQNNNPAFWASFSVFGSPDLEISNELRFLKRIKSRNIQNFATKKVNLSFSMEVINLSSHKANYSDDSEFSSDKIKNDIRTSFYEGDTVELKIYNNGKSKATYSLLNILSDGEVKIITPDLFNERYAINPGETRLIHLIMEESHGKEAILLVGYEEKKASSLFSKTYIVN